MNLVSKQGRRPNERFAQRRRACANIAQADGMFVNM